MGHTIVLLLKKFLEDNQVDMAMIHHTRLQALQRKTANALAKTIVKSLVVGGEVIEYDFRHRVARVIEVYICVKNNNVLRIDLNNIM